MSVHPCNESSAVQQRCSNMRKQWICSRQASSNSLSLLLHPVFGFPLAQLAQAPSCWLSRTAPGSVALGALASAFSAGRSPISGHQAKSLKMGRIPLKRLEVTQTPCPCPSLSLALEQLRGCSAAGLTVLVCLPRTECRHQLQIAHEIRNDWST